MISPIGDRIDRPRLARSVAARAWTIWLWCSLILVNSGLEAASQPRLHLGFINERPDRPSWALEHYDPLHQEMDARLAAQGISLGDLVIAQGIDDMAERIRRGEVDALFESVMPTLAIERRTGAIEPELLGWRKGQRQYVTVFFTRRTSPVERLQDLLGRTIAFEAPRSTSAYFVPRATLEAAGLQLAPAGEAARDGRSVRYLFAGSELNQAYWVQRGKADAGAFNDGDWDRTPATLREGLRIFHVTQPLPRWLVSFRQEVPPAVRQVVAEVLVTLHEDLQGRAALRQATRITRFEPLTSEDRTHIEHWRRILVELGP